MEQVERDIKKIIRMCRERDLRNAQNANANVEKLKAERNSAEYDLNMHRETCEKCDRKSIEELAASFGCSTGAVYARVYQDKSRALRNGF